MTKVVGPEFATKTPRISARNAGQPVFFNPTGTHNSRAVTTFFTIQVNRTRQDHSDATLSVEVISQQANQDTESRRRLPQTPDTKTILAPVLV